MTYSQLQEQTRQFRHAGQKFWFWGLSAPDLVPPVLPGVQERKVCVNVEIFSR